MNSALQAALAQVRGDSRNQAMAQHGGPTNDALAAFPYSEYDSKRSLLMQLAGGEPNAEQFVDDVNEVYMPNASRQAAAMGQGAYADDRGIAPQDAQGHFQGQEAARQQMMQTGHVAPWAADQMFHQDMPDMSGPAPWDPLGDALTPYTDEQKPMAQDMIAQGVMRPQFASAREPEIQETTESAMRNYFPHQTVNGISGAMDFIGAYDVAEAGRDIAQGNFSDAAPILGGLASEYALAGPVGRGAAAVGRAAHGAMPKVRSASGAWR